MLLNLSFSSFREAFVNRRVAFMAPLGFSSGLPLVLSGATLSAWMATEKVDLSTIGLFALVGISYNMKFLWAPLLDRFHMPWLSRRQGWMLMTQGLVLISIITLGNLDPVKDPFTVALVAFLLAFFSASQDIVIDAYRTDLLPAHERASGAAVFVTFYRIAMIVASAGALILSESISWRWVYMCLALLMLVGIIATFFSPKPDVPPGTPKSLREAVIKPLVEFFRRESATKMLLIVLTYKVGDYVASQMMMPFLIGMEFSRAEIGAVVKGLGLAASIVGGLLGGGLVAKYGLRLSMFYFGILQAVANVFYAVLAKIGRNHILLVVAIGVDNLFNGLGNAAFVAFMMALCDSRFSATQYALLSSAGTLVGRLLGGTSGWLAKRIGWPGFFFLTIVAALPAIFLIGVTRSKGEKWPPREIAEK